MTIPEVTHKCPIHSSRQLSENGYCVDCGFSWAQSVLRGYSFKYSWAKSDYEKALSEAKAEFQAKIGEIRLEAKEANQKLLEDSK